MNVQTPLRPTRAIRHLRLPRFAIAAIPLVVLLTATADATLLIDENFDNDPVGGNPTVNQLLLEQGTTVVNVVDASSTPADPFGGAGNRSFYLEDQDATDSAQLGWGTEPFVTQTTNLSLTFKTYVVNDATFNDTYQIIRVGENNALTSTLNTLEAAVDFVIQEDRFQVNQGANGGVLTLDQAPGVDFTMNSVWNMKIDISPATNTYELFVNNIQLTDDGGTVTQFNFRNNLGVNFVSFIGLSTNDATRVFYDDVVLEIPEPGSVTLLAGSGLALLFRRRRASY